MLGTYLPRVIVLVQREYVCNISWKEVNEYSRQNYKTEEMMQDVGFVEFFVHSYPHSEIMSLDQVLAAEDIADTLIFLPYCGYSQNYRVHPPDPWREATIFINNEEFHEMVRALEAKTRPDNIFYVAHHPLINPNWMHKLSLARALKVDSTIHGNRWDIVIPQSTREDHCPVSRIHETETDLVDDNKGTQEVLIFGAGTYKGGIFANLRKSVFDALNSLDKPDVDCSNSREKVAYDKGFANSKFCLVIPGDTASTSQGSRAVCAECVPVYIIPDFRDLPFANVLDYSTFSVRWLMSDFLVEGGAERLYLQLHEMVADGTHAKMKENVATVKPLFNFHRFDNKSPYLASLLSILEDQRVRNERF
ncbi:hypothetical protein TrVE_jg5021 [Triparma verrucosa]|uniref:Exostosin GT47 domain-containing protein n=1 Tax=Triparma verrucosa TaxID=1606542 RepID=A0A9W7EV65_9STRA|nr:hypothetical protein TrVE_jg5021 [Triparma verrucosa]